ncbi:MAG: thiamine pyrophosphate-binding protein [Pseudomonadota bacterium]
MSHRLRVENILSELSQWDVQTLALCPGGRNAPFVQALDLGSSFEVISFYDERSAGFFALGRARRDQKPVAIITTSGTAVSELTSAVIEAHYSGTPLVVVSADRPKNLRGTGAPQAIDQTQLFLGHIEKVYDLEDENLSLESWSGRNPIHINICFDEPLNEKSESPLKIMPEAKRQPIALKSSGSQDIQLKRGVVVVGGLHQSQRAGVTELLCDLKLPVFLESLSGLKTEKKLSHLVVPGGDKNLRRWFQQGEVKSVLRLGDVPVGRFWRDLEKSDFQVTSISDKNFLGLSHGHFFLHDLMDLSHFRFDCKTWDFSRLQAESRRFSNQVPRATGSSAVK